jgi:hypothetical protein
MLRARATPFNVTDGNGRGAADNSDNTNEDCEAENNTNSNNDNDNAKTEQYSIFQRAKMRLDLLEQKFREGCLESLVRSLREVRVDDVLKRARARIGSIRQSFQEGGAAALISSLTVQEKIGITVICFLLVWIHLLTGPDLADPYSMARHAVKQDKHHLFKLYSKDAPPCVPLSNRRDVRFTLVTQTSDDRLWLMKYHCELWEGPISIAVLTPKKNQEIEQILQNDHGCTVSPERVTVQTLKAEKQNEGEYPVNILRNMALRGVQTSHVMIVDMDFWPSESLYKTLRAPLLQQAFFKDDKLAMVIPAFQADPGLDWCRKKENCQEKLVNMMPRNKQALNDGMKKRVLIAKKTKTSYAPQYGYFVSPFLQQHHWAAHNSTNYYQWYTQAPYTLIDIPCVLSDMYEPYLALRYCHAMPPFQEVFTGYGQNKISWMLQLRKAGYALAQIGAVFVIHFPHDESPSKKIWKKFPEELGNWFTLPQEKNVPGRELKKYHRGKMDNYLVQFKEWLETKAYPPSDMNEDNEIERTGRCVNWVDDSIQLWVDGQE